MGFIYVPTTVADEDEMALQSRNDVLLADTAIDPDTAEQFETGVGKLALQEDGTVFPGYVVGTIPTLTILEKGDFKINIFGETVDPSTGHYRFSAYLGAAYTEDPGNYRFNVLLKAN